MYAYIHICDIYVYTYALIFTNAQMHINICILCNVSRNCMAIIHPIIVNEDQVVACIAMANKNG